MGTLYQSSSLHKSLPLSMGGSCVSDYIKKFAVRKHISLFISFRRYVREAVFCRAVI